MPADTTIHPFPELRALAEEEAKARADARAAYGYTHDTGGASWAAMAPTSRDIAVSVETALLCDLTRPASRDAVCRLVGARIGWCADEVIAACERDWFEMRALWRVAGMPELPRWEPQPPAPAALATIVRHLWPQE